MVRNPHFRRGPGTRAGRSATVFLAVVTALVAEVHAGLHFERVGSESGPPSDVITSIYQDRTGFVWIGSRDGLTFFDGYTFRLFEHDASDPHSISDNTIRTIYEDDQGNLWLGTNTGGLNRLDRATWRFEHFRHDSSDARSLSHDSVYAILQDRAGVLWVGTQHGLNRFDPATGTFERFLATREPGSLSHNYVYALHEDSWGGLWVSTIGGGLNLRDPATGTFTVHRHDPDDADTLNTDEVLAIAEDTMGDLWVSSMLGINRLDRKTGTFRRFGYEPGDTTALSDPLVPALAAGPPGKLWVATHGGGLNRIDTETEAIESWRHDPARRSSLTSDDVIALFADDDGTLWIGTWGGGLNRLTRSSLLLSASAERGRMPEGLDVNDVTSLMLDSTGGIWIGTRTGDVVRRDPETMIDRHYLYGGNRGTPRIILQFAEGLRGRIWIATNGGVARLDPRSGEHVDYYHDPQDPGGLGPGYVKGMLVDGAGGLWVGTGEGGLQRLDADGRVLDRFLHDPADPQSLSDDYVTALFEDSRGTLWVGTRSGGLNAFDSQTGRAARYLPRPGDDQSISHHYVTSILEDAEGTLWVGTGGGGLDRVDARDDGTLRFTRVTEATGFIDDDVMAIAEDDDGSLWVSTKRGMTRYDPRSGAFTNLSVADGLPSAEFEPDAATRDRSTLYFGTVKGLVAIPAGTPFPTSAPSPTVITSIDTASGSLRGDRPVWALESLGMPWGEWLSLEFAVLDYSGGQRHRYEYRLGGDDKPWVDLGSRREVTFTDLDPGTYGFAVRGRNGQGVWSQASPLLQIRVIPPFWMTSWFRALMLLLVIGLVVVGHQFRMSALERRNRELLALHEQRERAREQLRLAYERLSQLTRRMEAAKEEERKRIARDLHDDLGPALTAVIINLQLLGNHPEREAASRRIAETIDVVDRLIQRIRDMSLDLRPPLLDELGLVAALKGYLETQSERTGIRIDVHDEIAFGELPPEIEITAFRVVQEAVTNVFRHAEATHVKVDIRQTGRGLEIVVRDDGVGFDVRRTVEGAAGKALGLLGMQERVRMLDGELEIESQAGRGTEVRVLVPLEVGS